MTTATVPVLPAVAGQAETLGALIATAFGDLAISRWLVGDSAQRLRMQTGQFTMLVEHAIAHGQVHTTTDETAVAVWFPNDGQREIPPVPDYDQRLAAACGPHLTRFESLDTAMHDHHPPQPHWHLAFLAVHPSRQGHGLGSALLRHHHRHLDQNGIPAYLEAGDLRSRALYLRHGYQPHAEPFPVGPDAPSMYPLWRNPTATPHHSPLS
jgi:GNAT superfamily N-acetyltransferase